jgi:hypothetical protein
VGVAAHVAKHIAVVDPGRIPAPSAREMLSRAPSPIDPLPWLCHSARTRGIIRDELRYFIESDRGGLGGDDREEERGILFAADDIVSIARACEPDVCVPDHVATGPGCGLFLLVVGEAYQRDDAKGRSSSTVTAATSSSRRCRTDVEDRERDADVRGLRRERGHRVARLAVGQRCRQHPTLREPEPRAGRVAIVEREARRSGRWPPVPTTSTSCSRAFARSARSSLATSIGEECTSKTPAAGSRRIRSRSPPITRPRSNVNARTPGPSSCAVDAEVRRTTATTRGRVAIITAWARTYRRRTSGPR